MPMEGGHLHFYAVRRGRNPGVYKAWGECKQQVDGFPKNEHRRFHDLNEALAWLPGGPIPSPPPLSTSSVQPARRRSSRLLEGAFSSTPLSDYGSMIQLTSSIQGHGSGSSSSNLAGQVVLPHNERDLDLVAHSLLFYEEHFAHQEVAFTMFDKILSATGYTICDYNYRILGRVRKEEVRLLNDCIRRLEEENEELTRQLEMFREMLDE